MSYPMNAMQIEYLQADQLKLYKNTIRKLGKKQTAKLTRLIDATDFAVPIIVSKDHHVIIGHAFFEALKQLGKTEIPVVIAEHLSDEQARQLRIAYDRIAEEESWDRAALAAEVQELLLIDPEMDLTITGLEMPEIDLIIDFNAQETPVEDEIPIPEDGPTVAQPGDLFSLGSSKILCGDSLQESSYTALMGDEKAQMVFTDFPYNLEINGQVCGLGSIKHPEFAMASGEMDDGQFTDFQAEAFNRIRNVLMDGGMLFCCMDWRHTVEIQIAARRNDLTLKNICVWVKDNGGMGSLYRSRHEFIFVLKHGNAPHINNILLGSLGRYRTNVWEFPGVNTLRKGRMDDLAMHPTVKPVAMVAEAIKDCSKRGGIILDPFGGSGTTLIACEKTGRKARLIEIEPKYVDVTIRRWQKLTGQKAVLTSTGQYFDDIEPGSRSIPATDAAE